jgi:hypothetical protein
MAILSETAFLAAVSFLAALAVAERSRAAERSERRDFNEAIRGLQPGGTPTTTPSDIPDRPLSLGDIGKGTVRLFGLEGKGYKFVYVFDRSGSMGGDGRSCLAAAKAELAASLEGLEKTQQFQIIFYNENPLLFNPAGYSGRLAFATEANKQRALRFMETIAAEDGTDHEKALRAALGLRPDVVFFLTDADEPKLTDQQLADIRRWAAGTIIHTVEFGQGPDSGGDNFLRRLARENGGKHVYVDVTRLAPGGRD